MLDNLSTHTAGALYQAFPPAEARRLLNRLQFHYVPKHASWLNMVEIEIGAQSMPGSAHIFARWWPRTNRVSCDVFCVGGHGRIAVRLFIFTPFDTARRPDGTGRLRARRRMGQWSEQNGQPGLLVAAGYHSLRNQNRIVRGGGSIRSPSMPSATSHAYALISSTDEFCGASTA